MTVSTIGSVAEFDTNGVTTNYPFYFKFLANEDLVVTYVNPAGVSSVLTLGTNYTVNGAGNEQGGSIVTTSALAGPGQLIVSREMDAFQQTSLRNQGKFLAETHEDVFDKLTMLIQQGFSIFKRALTRPFGRDYFYAENRRITDVKDPVEAQDAVTKKWSLVFLGDLVSAIQGPINNALNIFYRAPDLTAHVVQDLSGPDGARLIGDGVGTVKGSLDNLSANDVALQVNINSVNLAADVGNFGKNVMLNRIRSKIATGPLAYILGDSITHGAFAGDLYRNGWANIFKRMFNAEFNTFSYGFAPSTVMTNPVDSTLSYEVHNIVLDNVGGPHSWTVLDSSAASYLAQGMAFVSNAAGNIFRTTVASFQDNCAIYYVAKPGGGTFDVKRNGVVVGTVNTASSTIDPFARYVISMADNGVGSCVIEIVTTSAARIEACGFGYFDATAQLVLNNFSTSGRKLRNIDEGTISGMLNEAAFFVMALGVNDVDQNEVDSSYYASFVQRIDWIIQYAVAYEVPIVVADFVWNFPTTNKTRMQLKRLADEANGSYIPFPDFFMKNGSQPGGAYLTNILKLFVDGIHPNADGHRYIAETVAKKIGFGVTSKKAALDYYDWWFPLELNTAASVTNKGTTSRLVSATKNQGSQILFRLNVTGLAGAVTKGIALGYPARAGIGFDIPVTSQLTPTNAGLSQGVCIVNAAGVSVITNAQNATADHQLFLSVPRSE